MSRPIVLTVFAVLVTIWSSTWVAIKFGLEDTPPLLGAGVRFAIAGALLLGLALLQRRRLRTDVVLAAILALLPFAVSYGLVYWGEQHIPSGLAAVLFGMMPLYVAVMAAMLVDQERVNGRLFAGLFVALAGLAVAFGESIALGDSDMALLGAGALVLSPLAAAIGNVALRMRAGELDAVVLNGWAMLAGGVLLLGASAIAESWGDAVWTMQAWGAILYLAIPGSALAFVLLTLLLQHVSVIAVSVIPLLLPFGALVFGAVLYDEALTATAIAGAALVAGGILIGQAPGRRGRQPATAPIGEPLPEAVAPAKR